MSSASAEPPLRVSPDVVELEPRTLGQRQIDWVAGAAILISVISLAIAVKHGQTMERLVAANSWPLLQYNTGNANDQNKPVINLSIENAGVGPAIVKHFSIVYGGRRFSRAEPLLAACCSDGKLPPGTSTTTTFVEDTVINAGESIDFLKFARRPESETVWVRLDRQRFAMTFDACYCSVFGECWRSDLTRVDPRRVGQCPAPIGGNPSAGRRAAAGVGK